MDEHNTSEQEQQSVLDWTPPRTTERSENLETKENGECKSASREKLAGTRHKVLRLVRAERSGAEQKN
jgi:hypothetical protein